jgi:lysophospholipase L1-like esterase
MVLVYNFEMPRADGLVSKLLALFIGLLVAAMSAEAATRALERFVLFYDLEMAKYAADLKIPAEDPYQAHRHRPHAKARLMGVEIALNSIGLRNGEVTTRKSAGTVRILVLGDSIALGWGVEEKDCFARRLEGMLNRRAAETGGPAYEVVNAGVGNYNTVQEWAYFKNAGHQLDPDMILLAFFINDAEPVARRSRSFFLNHSHFAVLAWSKLERMKSLLFPGQGYREYYRRLYSDSNPGWPRCRKALLELSATCAQNRKKLLVVLLPELHDLRDPYPFEDAQRMVSEVLRSRSVEVLDLVPHFKGLEGRSLWVSSDDAHPNGIAHERIAEAIFRRMSEPGGAR